MISGTTPYLRIKRIIAYTFTLLVMVAIFNFSAQPAEKSKKTSSTITKKIVKVVTKNKNITAQKKKELEKKWEKTIRKIAHFSLFALLGLCVFVSTALTFIKKGSHFLQKDAVISLIICLLYAISDEVHQAFVPGRSCQATDVLIDLSGSLAGIIIVSIILYLINKKKQSV